MAPKPRRISRVYSFRALPNGSAALLAHAASFAPDGLPPPPPDPGLPPVTPPRPVHADVVPGNILATADGPC
jgi:thiamine kinase